jgi:hypothetical protein
VRNGFIRVWRCGERTDFFRFEVFMGGLTRVSEAMRGIRWQHSFGRGIFGKRRKKRTENCKE